MPTQSIHNTGYCDDSIFYANTCMTTMATLYLDPKIKQKSGTLTGLTEQLATT